MLPSRLSDFEIHTMKSRDLVGFQENTYLDTEVGIDVFCCMTHRVFAGEHRLTDFTHHTGTIREHLEYIHHSDVTWASLRIKSPANIQFVQQFVWVNDNWFMRWFGTEKEASPCPSLWCPTLLTHMITKLQWYHSDEMIDAISMA